MVFASTWVHLVMPSVRVLVLIRVFIRISSFVRGPRSSTGLHLTATAEVKGPEGEIVSVEFYANGVLWALDDIS